MKSVIIINKIEFIIKSKVIGNKFVRIFFVIILSGIVIIVSVVFNELIFLSILLGIIFCISVDIGILIIV